MKRKLITYRFVFQYNPIFGLSYDCHITSEDVLVGEEKNQKVKKRQEKNHKSIVLQKNLFERRQFITKSVEFNQKHSIDNIDNENQDIQTKVVLISTNKRTVRQYKQRKFYIEQTKEAKKIQKKKENKRIPQEMNNKKIVRDLLNESYLFSSNPNNNNSTDYDYQKDDNLICIKNRIFTKNGSYGIF